METLVVAVVIGLIPAFIARGKGHSFLLWWLLGAAMFVVFLPFSLMLKRKLPPNMAPCPACKGHVSIQATVCPHCGHPLRTQIPTAQAT